ncbi:MAG: hypothetical protein AB2792_21940, partial [Candidatus Thiodiazotropha sp.]
MMPWRWLNKPIADTHAEGSTANVAFGLPAISGHLSYLINEVSDQIEISTGVTSTNYQAIATLHAKTPLNE